MKCVKFIEGKNAGKIENVADTEAFALVKANKATFATRQEWKEKTRKFLTKVAPVVSEAIKEQKKEENKIGRAIANARKAKGLTQDELGMKLGIEKRMVAAWERGKEVVDGETLVKISAILDKKVG